MFWDRFYELCIEKETKPNTIAREIGVSNAICTKWKKTGVIPNGETLEKIANRLDCSIDYLLGRTENPTAHVKSNEADRLDNDPVTEEILRLLKKLSAEQKKAYLEFLKQFANK